MGIIFLGEVAGLVGPEGFSSIARLYKFGKVILASNLSGIGPAFDGTPPARAKGILILDNVSGGAFPISDDQIVDIGSTGGSSIS